MLFHKAHVRLAILCCRGLLLCMVQLTSCCANGGSSSSEATLRELRAQADIQGMSVAVRNVFQRPDQWVAIQQQIEGADPNWVQFAADMFHHADAGAREMLSHSLAGALDRAPGLLLTLAKSKQLNTSDFCIGPDVDDDRYATLNLAMTALKRRVVAVDSVSAPDLNSYKGACLKERSRQSDSVPGAVCRCASSEVQLQLVAELRCVDGPVHLQ